MFGIFKLRYQELITKISLRRTLVRLVSQYGTKKWSQISKMLTGRVGKQCRERWYNHLKPDIKVLFQS